VGADADYQFGGDCIEHGTRFGERWGGLAGEAGVEKWASGFTVGEAVRAHTSKLVYGK